MGKIPEEVTDYTENIVCLCGMLYEHSKNLYTDSNMIMRDIMKAKTLLGSDDVIECPRTQDEVNAVAVHLDKLQSAIRDVFKDAYVLQNKARKAPRRHMPARNLTNL